jgi:hypothetical protein
MDAEKPNLSKFISKYLKSQNFEYQGMNVKFTDVFSDPELGNTNYFFTVSVESDGSKSFVAHFLFEYIGEIIEETLNHFYGKMSWDLSYEWKVLYNNEVFLKDDSVIISRENLSLILNELKKFMTIFKHKGSIFEISSFSIKYKPVSWRRQVVFEVKLKKLPDSNDVHFPLNALSEAMKLFTEDLNLGKDFHKDNENQTEIDWVFS